MDWSAGRRWWQLTTKMGLLAICSYYCVSIFSFCSVHEALNMEYTRIPQELPDKFLKIWLFSFIRQQGVHMESTGSSHGVLVDPGLLPNFIEEGVNLEWTWSPHGVLMESLESTWSLPEHVGQCKVLVEKVSLCKTLLSTVLSVGT